MKKATKTARASQILFAGRGRIVIVVRRVTVVVVSVTIGAVVRVNVGLDRVAVRVSMGVTEPLRTRGDQHFAIRDVV